jgi:hypothetical protein
MFEFLNIVSLISRIFLGGSTYYETLEEMPICAESSGSGTTLPMIVLPACVGRRRAPGVVYKRRARLLTVYTFKRLAHYLSHHNKNDLFLFWDNALLVFDIQGSGTHSTEGPWACKHLLPWTCKIADRGILAADKNKFCQKQKFSQQHDQGES